MNLSNYKIELATALSIKWKFMYTPARIICEGLIDRKGNKYRHPPITTCMCIMYDDKGPPCAGDCSNCILRSSYSGGEIFTKTIKKIYKKIK